MKSLVWFRRDLRLHDNSAASYATHNSDEVYGVFVFDKNILDKIADKNDHRVDFILRSLQMMNETLAANGSKLYVLHGDPAVLVPKLAKSLGVGRVCANRDYESYAKERDEKVRKSLENNSIDFQSFKDHVVFESSEIKTNQGSFYKVFTPYSRVWLKKLHSTEGVFSERPVELKKFSYTPIKNMKEQLESLALEEIGFAPTDDQRWWDADPSKRLKSFFAKVDRYAATRDLPGVDGTSQLSVYLRFGNLSIRELVRKVLNADSEGKKTWLNELIWRDFYSGFLDTHNYVENESYKYPSITWEKNEEQLKAWKEGRTGVPIVDAGMRQLNQTGWMHNRVRMIVGSYLTKIMFIDWREGEKYFGEKLIDYDLASNNGGWQWCSSTGTDAVPYFRIFNPYTQAERFDKGAKYIKKFVPELEALPPKYVHNPTLITEKIETACGFKLGEDYPRAIADYKKGRERALKTFKESV